MSDVSMPVSEARKWHEETRRYRCRTLPSWRSKKKYDVKSALRVKIYPSIIITFPDPVCPSIRYKRIRNRSPWSNNNIKGVTSSIQQQVHELTKEKRILSCSGVQYVQAKMQTLNPSSTDTHSGCTASKTSSCVLPGAKTRSYSYFVFFSWGSRWIYSSSSLERPITYRNSITGLPSILQSLFGWNSLIGTCLVESPSRRYPGPSAVRLPKPAARGRWLEYSLGCQWAGYVTSYATFSPVCFNTF